MDKLSHTDESGKNLIFSFIFNPQLSLQAATDQQEIVSNVIAL